LKLRIAGDLYDKVLNLPAQEFQVRTNQEVEGVLASPLSIKNFISKQVLSKIFDSAAILVFRPVLIGYSPALGALVMIFTFTIDLITLVGRWREKEAANLGAPAEAARRRAIQSSVAGIETVKSFSLESSQRRHWRQVASKSILHAGKRDILGLVVKNVTSTLQQIMTICLVFLGNRSPRAAHSLRRS